MSYVGERTIKLPCPDSVTGKECPGKIKIKIQSFRAGRGHGDFHISVDTEEKNEFVCDECGIKFRFQEPTARFPRMFFTVVE